MRMSVRHICPTKGWEWDSQWGCPQTVIPTTTQHAKVVQRCVTSLDSYNPLCE